MIIDEAKISLSAGRGGDGIVSFRKEKFVQRGGPDGGDGGNGGSIIVKADPHISDLSKYNAKKDFKAEHGQNGMPKKMKGKAGEDLILSVPLGTQVFDKKGRLLLDALKSKEILVLAKGGNGGWGNIHFATSIKQAPEWSKEGLAGETQEILLELKTIADVGLVGLPNAGKSTLLSVITNAKPKIADYPFTTLEPNLGAIKTKDKTVIIADIPGLIEGAAKGKGLGVKFLKHIERTKSLVHMIDAMSDDVVKDYKTIRAELGQFSKKLIKKDEIVVLNKVDVLNENEVLDRIKQLKKIKVTPLVISAATSEGIDKFKKVLLGSV